MTRKQARETAFIFIFEKEISALSTDEIIKNAIEARGIETDEYAVSVFGGVYDNLGVIDDTITANLSGWNISRISKVSLALLRLAVYEMMFVPDVPVSVSINEAVELCKKFATKEDSAYVNGVLGTISKQVEKE